MTNSRKNEGGDSDSTKVTLNSKELWIVLKRVLTFSSPDFLSLSLGTISLFVNSLTNLYFPYAIGKIFLHCCIMLFLVHV